MENKQIYELPSIEVISVDTDIITASGPTTGGTTLPMMPFGLDANNNSN